MSIRKENPKIDFVSNEHDILDFWEKEKISHICSDFYYKKLNDV